MLLNDNSVHLEADMYFMVNGNYRFKPDKLPSAHQWCQRETSASLATNKRTIVSNTFTTVAELEPYFAIASDYGIIPSVIVCQNSFDNIHNVPADTLEKMKQRWAWNIEDLFERYKK
jgi:hypothetical protein